MNINFVKNIHKSTENEKSEIQINDHTFQSKFDSLKNTPDITEIHHISSKDLKNVGASPSNYTGMHSENEERLESRQSLISSKEKVSKRSNVNNIKHQFKETLKILFGVHYEAEIVTPKLPEVESDEPS